MTDLDQHGNCPRCGYCKCCGRGGPTFWFYPYQWQQQPYAYYWAGTNTTSNTTGITYTIN